MARVLILGYGNPLRGDDGLGWHAAEALRAALPDAEIVTSHQLTPELAETASRAELVIFVDAGVGDCPGEWRAVPVASVPETTRAFSHHVTPASILEAARLLYGRAPEGVLFSMTAASFDFGAGLSAPVTAALPAMLDAIIARCR